MAELPAPEALSNEIYQYADSVTIKSGYEFYGIEIDFIKLEEGLLRFNSKLPNDYAFIYGTSKIIIFKLTNNSYPYENIETELFSHYRGFRITRAVICTRDLSSYDLYINFNELEHWETLRGDSEWDSLTQNWEEIKGDGKSDKLKWHTISDYDKEKETTTYKKELRNK